MTISDAPRAVLSVLAGLALGVMFFGGVWWTVRRVLVSSRPAGLMLISMLVRTGLVVAGFYLVSDGHLQRLLFCLMGFMIARLLATRGLPRVEALGGAVL